MSAKCRHPKRLWSLSRDKKYALCGRCGLRVAVLTPTSVYTRMVECPSCDGVGAMAGAHTERIEPCPYCGGSGLVESKGVVQHTMIHGTAT